MVIQINKVSLLEYQANNVSTKAPKEILLYFDP